MKEHTLTLPTGTLRRRLDQNGWTPCGFHAEKQVRGVWIKLTRVGEADGRTICRVEPRDGPVPARHPDVPLPSRPNTKDWFYYDLLAARWTDTMIQDLLGAPHAWVPSLWRTRCKRAWLRVTVQASESLPEMRLALARRRRIRREAEEKRYRRSCGKVVP